jgi:hypothetical protein
MIRSRPEGLIHEEYKQASKQASKQVAWLSIIT